MIEPPVSVMCRAASRVPAITALTLVAITLEITEVVVEQAALHLSGDPGVC